MKPRPRRGAGRAGAALVLAGVLAVGGGCAGAPVSPLPVDQPSASVSVPTPQPVAEASTGPAAGPARRATAAAVRPASSPRRATATAVTSSPSPEGTSTCDGAVLQEVDLNDSTVRMWQSTCIGVGGVLRVRNIGPGDNGLSAEPEELVSTQYEAGTVDIRFVRAGTVTVTLPLDGGSHRLTVVVRS